MPNIQIVENPRRRKSRKGYTRKQLAAGFGGKRKMTRRRKTRRNPTLATLAGNPRRRYTRRATPARRRRARSNPGMLAGIPRLFNLKMAASVGVGITTAHLAPNLITKVWAAAPTAGLPGTAIRIGAVLLVGTASKMLMKDNTIAVGIVAGGIGYEIYKFLAENVVPKIGFLNGYQYIGQSELDQYGINGYRDDPARRQYIDPVLAA